MENVTEEYPWLKRFLDIISIALLKGHHEYINWSIGQAGIKEKKSLFNDNLRGIELADEPTVCSMITIEALKSPLFSGDFDSNDPKNNDPKYYRINREKLYPDSQKRVDMVIERYKPSEIDENFKPVYIEAKRAVRFSISDISTGNSGNPYVQTTEVDKDIKKLKEANLENVHKYILVWGVYEVRLDSTENKLPTEFYAELKSKRDINNHFVRWIPISWKNMGFDTPTTTEITKWIWVVMMEIGDESLTSKVKELKKKACVWTKRLMNNKKYISARKKLFKNPLYFDYYKTYGIKSYNNRFGS